MKKSTSRYKNVAAYIAAQQKEIQPLLKKMQQVIKSSAPKSDEIISYNMPAYKVKNQIKGYPLVYFAAGKHHIGLYPMPSAIRKFKADILKNKYKWATGSVQFPLDRPLPITLIRKMIRFRASEMKSKKK